MTEVGMWVQTLAGEKFLVKKDANGYPDLIPLDSSHSFEDIKAKKEKATMLYEEISEKKYPHPNATTRQVLWDFLEMAIQKLP